MMEPSRRVVTRSPHRTVGLIACSWVQDTAIEYESQLERRFVQRTLLLAGLTKIVHQPFKINYLDGGQQLEYTPDFLVVIHHDYKVVVEVKPRIFVKQHLKKFAAAKAFFQEVGIQFFVITDQEIDGGITANNVALILRYGRGEIATEIQNRCLTALERIQHSISIGELQDQAQATMTDVLYLVARGKLSLTLSDSIDLNTQIQLAAIGEQNGHLCFCRWFGIEAW